MSARRSLVVFSLVVVGAASACILGPKQDDPSSGTAANPDIDAGVTDSGGGFRVDSGTSADAQPPPFDTSPAPGDVGGSDTSAKSDTGTPSDAVGDAGDAAEATSDAGETSIDDGGEAGILDAPTD